MTPAERREEIVSIVRQRGRVTVEDLARQLGVSRETVRRDLTRLEAAGRIRKFHGGATLPLSAAEGPFRSRMHLHAAEKARIARLAVRLVAPGETLFIDTGSTTVYFAEELARVEGLTVITNSAEVARILDAAGNGTRVYMLGGQFRSDNRQTVGAMTLAQIRQFRAHHCVLTIGALDARTGAMDFDIEEAQVARGMIEQAESLTILVDSSKFDTIASFEVCPLSRVDNLVCDRPPEGGLLSALQAADVRLHVAEAVEASSMAGTSLQERDD